MSGVFETITFGFGELKDVRQLLGIVTDGDKRSGAYGYSRLLGNFVNPIPEYQFAGIVQKMKLGNNRAANKVARDALLAAEKILDKKIDRKVAHDLVSKQGLNSCDEILEEFLSFFG